MVEADAVEYPTTVDLLPAADVVMSGFSTTNYFAILLGLRDVVYAGTPQLLADLQAEKGLQRPPETTAGAGWCVLLVCGGGMGRACSWTCAQHSRPFQRFSRRHNSPCGDSSNPDPGPTL